MVKGLNLQKIFTHMQKLIVACCRTKQNFCCHVLCVPYIGIMLYLETLNYAFVSGYIDKYARDMCSKESQIEFMFKA
jgi:hypothetical protein